MTDADPTPADPAPSDPQEQITSSDSQEQIATAVAEAVAPLKANNAALKAEKTEIRKTLEQLQGTIEALGGDEGLEQLQNLRTTLEKDEAGKLLAEGRHDEWFDKRTASMRADHQRQLEALQGQTKELEDSRDKSVSELRSYLLKAQVDEAALAASANSTALPDILRAAREAYQYDDDLNMFVYRDTEGSVVYGKDGTTPLDPGEWIESCRKTSPHWWPPSQGTNALGSGMAGDSNDPSDIPDDITQDEYVAIRKAQGAQI